MEDKKYYEDIAKNLEFETRALIDGELVNSVSNDTFESFNPSTGEKICEITSCNIEDLERAVKAARRSFNEGVWSRMPLKERKEILYRFSSLIEENAETLAVMESIDCGKPISDTINGDLPETVECFRFAAEAIDKLNDEVTPTDDGCLNITKREPIGVCAAIVPWNFPILMAAWKLAPILASGNSVIIKPSQMTSLTLLKLGALSIEAGIPKGVLNILTGSGSVIGGGLASHMDVDLITFTGSTEVGRGLLEKSGKSNLKRVLLELGGKSPSVVMPNIKDLRKVAKEVVNAGLWNMGQNCTQNSRIIVHREIKDKLLPLILEEVKNWTVGNSLDRDSVIGPLISKEHMEKVLNYIEIGKSEGGKLLYGGKRIKEEEGGNFVLPAVFDEVTMDMTIAREEIFGPVFSIITCDSLEDGIKMANDTNYGLQASVYSDDINEVYEMAKSIRAGVISVNHFSEGDQSTPFGGFKESGFFSRDKSIWSNKQYTELKSIYVRV